MTIDTTTQGTRGQGFTEPVLWELDAGAVQIDRRTGAPLQFHDRQNPDRRFLLDVADDAWHTQEHAWGTGFVVTDLGSARWNSPSSVTLSDNGSVAAFELFGGLSLEIERRAAGSLTEQYRFHNAGPHPVSVTSIGISTPFREVYERAEDCLRRGINAHIWTGGTDAWVAAQPMSGVGPVLALRLTTGRLSAYSLESRNAGTASNVRGHVVLHPTDAARNSTAFGGQTPIEIGPGERYDVAWTVGFQVSMAAFESTLTGAVDRAELTALLGTHIELPVPRDHIVIRSDSNIDVRGVGSSTRLFGRRHGTVEVTVDGIDTAVFFHLPVEEIVRRRVRFIAAHQTAREREGIDSNAFLPLDTRTRLTQPANGWNDWSDGAERIGMPTLIQQAALRGWISMEEATPLLRGWSAFARARLVDASGSVRWGSNSTEPQPRIYNFPWLAHFYADQFRLFGDLADLALAATILEKSYELNAREHLSLGQPEAVTLIAQLLDETGDPNRADLLRHELLASADHFVSIGAALPSHEVNYEQSMVAPLVSLLATAEQLAKSGKYLAYLTEAVGWMRAFGGPQPHARLRSIGIRHWDGYWFGLNRQWGDVFPHHWSVLTAVALMELPEALRTRAHEDEASRIFATNLVSFEEDGSATAAFVFPSAVDSVAAHRADPLANDQDWALTLLLRSGHPLALE